MKSLRRVTEAISLPERIRALEQNNLELRGAVDQLYAELRARPFTTRPDILRTTDDEGRPAIGFRHADSPGRNGYLGFEDVFRGAEQLVRERQAIYVDVVRDHAPVLDVGCGRGEFLQLLAEAGIAAAGVDTDGDMVELGNAKGLDIILGDGVEHLAQSADASLGAIFCAQLIEHLSFTRLNQFFELAVKKLRPGGVLVAETVNPHSIQAMQTFWVDPTHTGPIFPDVAVTLCWLHGFAEAQIIFPLGQGDLARDLYDTGEYAVVARSAG